LLTFSRGGIVVAGIASLIMIIYYNITYIRKNFTRVAGIAMISIIGALVTFSAVNRISGGLLLLRYQGETEGTLAGSKEKTFDVIVTNRASILEGDIDLFLENPLLGVGVGASRFLRKSGEDEPAHVEFSRLLADHGFLGLLYFIFIIVLFNKNLARHRNSADRGLLIAFFLIAMLTSFHAAMRTYVSPVFYLLSYMSIRRD
jgi:O-antigen ligase